MSVFFAISLLACAGRGADTGVNNGPSDSELPFDGSVSDGTPSDATPLDGSVADSASDADIAAEGEEDLLEVEDTGGVDVPSEVVVIDVGPASPDTEDVSPEPPAPDVLAEIDALEEEDTSGINIVVDAGTGPILGPPDVDEVADADAEPSLPDVELPEPDAAPPEPEVTPEEDVSVEPDVVEPDPTPTSCEPNPCYQPAPHTCSADTAESRFVPGACLMVGGTPACSYPSQAMDCAAAGGSCVNGACEGSPASPAEGELVVVEVMRNPFPDTRQWLEVFVAADTERNLAGCGIADGAGNVHVFSEAPVIVAPGDFVLIAEAEPTSDGVPAPEVTIPVGALDLLSDAGPLIVNCMGTLVDVVDYTGQTPLYPFPSEQGVSMQVGSGNYTVEANDDSKVWCSSPDPYTFGGYGSPGEANPSCNADVDRCKLWFPAFGVGFVGEPLEVTAVVFDEGITNVTINGPDVTNELTGQLGIGPDGTNPEVAPQEFIWFDGVPDYTPPTGVPPTEDMYGAWVVPEAAGTFDLAARFTPDGGLSWLYCDLDGSNNGYQTEEAGHVVVNP